MFPVGATAVRCTATAANGATGSCSFTVNVTPPAARLSRTRFLAFGDSLTAGEVTVPSTASSDAGADSLWQTLIVLPQASYPTQLEMLLRARYTQQLATTTVANAGRSGESAVEGARRFPDIVANSRPEVVLLLEGANDLALGQTAMQPAVQAVNAMAREARFRNARVFIATLPPPRSSGNRALSSSLVQSYNAALVQVARGEGAVLVDLYAALLSNVNTYIGVDGLHPTEAGYRRMAEAFFDAIRQDLEIRP